MAFGAWRGGMHSQAGQYGLSGMFEGLSQGLGQLGKLYESRESDERKLKFANAQEAANHAFQMNLARFNRDAMASQAENTQKHEDARHASTVAEQSKDRQLSRELSAQNHHDTLSIENARLGMEGQRLGFEKDKSERDARRADTADTRAAEAARKNSTNEQLRSIHDTNSSYESQIKELEKDMKDRDVDPDSDEASGYRQKIGALHRAIDAGNKESHDLRNGLKQPASSQNVTPEKTSPDAASSGGQAPLPADRQALVQQYIKAGAQPADAYKTVSTLPQDAVEKAMKAKPPQASADGAGQPNNAAIDDFISTGQTPGANQQSAPPSAMASAPPQGSADAAPPAATAPAPAQDAADPSDAAPPDAAPDPSAQYAQMSQKLQQTPEGQGALTTLDRLAEAPQGPIADKMRRAAENSLSAQFPDGDPNGFIDYYLHQQQQEPQAAPEAADTEMA